MNVDDRIGMAIAAVLIVIFFIFFFATAKPKEPERIWVPGHYEYVREPMKD